MSLQTSEQESRFISVSRLLMICGLVYHHLFEIPGSSHSPRLNMENYTYFLPEFLNSFFHMAFMTAVPALSVISGFLFFNRPNMQYGELLKRRVFTVALPTWLWSSLWLLFAFSLYSLGQRFAWLDYGFESATPMTWINGIIGVTRQPFAFQFWFVHDLMLTLLLTPIISFFLLRLGKIMLAVMAAVWICVPYPPVFFSGNVLMFFTVGAYLAMPSGPGLGAVLAQLRRYRWALLALFTTVLIARVMSHKMPIIDSALQSYAYLCLLRVIGVLTSSALLYHMVMRMPSTTNFVLRYSGYSFFIFAAHYPIVELLQEPVPLIPGYDSTPGLILSWLLIPALTIILILVIARCCERYFPLSFKLLNGGRAGEKIERFGVTVPASPYGTEEQRQVPEFEIRFKS